MAQDITVLLNNPLVQFSKEQKTLVYRLKGKLEKQDTSGLSLKVKSIGDEKGWLDNSPPFTKVFIPIHKIDYIELEN